MKRRVVQPFFTAYGVKKRGRKASQHTHQIRAMSEEHFELHRETLQRAFRAWLNSEFKSVAAAHFSYWPGEETEDGIQTFLPFSPVVIEKIAATQPMTQATA